MSGRVRVRCPKCDGLGCHPWCDVSEAAGVIEAILCDGEDLRIAREVVEKRLATLHGDRWTLFVRAVLDASQTDILKALFGGAA